MSDELEICCPFCDSADGCKHLVASFDHENVAIGGGVFLDHEDEVSQLIRRRLIAIGPTSGWEAPPDFVDLWESFIEQPGEPLDSGLSAQLLDALLRSTDAICEEDGGVVAFFDRKPANVYDEVVRAIQRACEVSP
jgi:hypothetical protein